MRSIIYNWGIGKIQPKCTGGAHRRKLINQPVSTPRHGEGPRAKTWGASTPANSAVPFDRRRPPDGGGEEQGYSETCVISLRCARHRRARPRPLMVLFYVFLNHFNEKLLHCFLFTLFINCTKLPCDVWFNTKFKF